MKKKEPLIFFLNILIAIIIFNLSLIIYTNEEYKKFEISGKEINLISHDGMEFISVNLGNSAKIFLLDSGASESMINSSEIKGLNYKKLNNGTYSMANGDIIECERIMIDKIVINDIEFTDFTFAVIATEGDNLLGKNFFSNFKKWSINYQNNKLIVFK